MTEESVREGGWLRLLGLLALALTLAVGQPFVLVVVAFAMLTFLAPGGRILVLLLTAGAFAAVFAGEPAEGLWYLERGWAILVGGWFVAFSLLLPGRPFMARALPALLGGIVCVGGILAVLGGWSTVESLVAERVEASMAATLQLMNALAEGDLQVGLTETLSTTARVQGVLFPALLGLSSLASLGGAWWLHARVSPLGSVLAGSFGSRIPSSGSSSRDWVWCSSPSGALGGEDSARTWSPSWERCMCCGASQSLSFSGAESRLPGGFC